MMAPSIPLRAWMSRGHHALFAFALAAAAQTASASAAETSQWSLVRPTQEQRTRVTSARPSFSIRASGIDAAHLQPLRFLIDQVDVTEFVHQRTEGDSSIYTFRSPLPLELGPHEVTVAQLDGSRLLTVGFARIPPQAGITSTAKFSDGSSLEWKERANALLGLSPHTDGKVAGAAGELSWDITAPYQVDLEGDDQEWTPPDAVIRWRREARGENRLGLDALLGSARSSVPRASAFHGSKLLAMKGSRRLLGVGGNGRNQRVDLFSNLSQGLPGASGERSFDQWFHGASWSGFWLDDRLTIGLYGLKASDRADTGTSSLAVQREETDIVAAAVRLRLSERWRLRGEFAVSDRKQPGLSDSEALRELTGARSSSRDQAIFLGLTGAFAGNELEATLREVDARFLNPLDPGLDADRREAQLELSRRTKRWSYRARALRAEDGLERITSGNREDLIELEGGFKIFGFDGRVRWKDDETSGPGLDASHSRWSVDLRRKVGAVRFDLRLAETDTESTSTAGSRIRQRNESSERARLAFDWEALRTGAARLRLRGGASDDTREQRAMETTARGLFLNPNLELFDATLRFDVRVDVEEFEQPRRRDEQRESARATVSYRIHKRTALELVAGFDWSRRKDALRPASGSQTDQRVSLGLSWSPERLLGGR